MVSGPGKKSNRAVTMRLRSWHLLLKMDFSWVQRRRVHVRRDWGPAAHTCLWVPPPLSGSHVVWPFFLPLCSTISLPPQPCLVAIRLSISLVYLSPFLSQLLSASVTLHQLLMFVPFRISPHPILLLLSPPFSSHVFFSSPPTTHCLSGIPLYPSRAGRSR